MTVASIDIGTNTVLLLIAEINHSTKRINPLIERIAMPRVGRGLISGSRFPDQNLLKLYTVLNEYCSIIKSYNCESVFVCATNAFRIASNRSEVVEEIKKVFNININVIDGETEALYSFYGAVSNSQKSNSTLVIDIGGGSTEIIIGDQNSIKYRKSFQLGVVTLSEKHFSQQPPSAVEIEKMKEEVSRKISELGYIKQNFTTSIAVAGTPTTLACVKKSIRNFDAQKIDGTSLYADEIHKMILQLSHLTNEKMREQFGNIVEGREDILLSGALILMELGKVLNINEIIVSTRGIRYGVIADYLKNH